MAKSSQHSEWLSLIEVVGAFFSARVLEGEWSNGLDKTESMEKARRRMRQAYEELTEAIETNDPDLDRLQKCWIQLVLEEGLEFRNVDLAPNERFVASSDEKTETISPDYVLFDGDKPLFSVPTR